MTSFLKQFELRVYNGSPLLRNSYKKLSDSTFKKICSKKCLSIAKYSTKSMFGSFSKWQRCIGKIYDLETGGLNGKIQFLNNGDPLHSNYNIPRACLLNRLPV